MSRFSSSSACARSRAQDVARSAGWRGTILNGLGAIIAIPAVIHHLDRRSLPRLGVEKINTWVVDRSQSHALRFAGHTADSRSFGTAINHV
jgi:hypothetical protein